MSARGPSRRVGARRPGLYEYQVAATMTESSPSRLRAPAYSPIVGSGPNSVYLHYSRNSRRMDTGEVLLMDVAAECAGYASDITRTIPVGGKFSSGSGKSTRSCWARRKPPSPRSSPA